MNKEAWKQLAGEGIILLDGATGSNLTKAGMPKGTSTEVWTLEHADILIGLQRAYIEAGSRIVYAPTFAANRISLENFGRESQVEELNTRLTELSKEAVKGTDTLIAGDITTTGKMLEPLGDMTYNRLFDAYAEQITALANAGVDLLVAETMMSVEETCIALDAANTVCDLPMMCSLTIQADGSAYFGGSAVEAMETLQEMGAAAVGINCSLGPDQLESVVSSMARIAKIPVIAKPNAGMPTISPTGEAIYNMDAETFAGHMETLVNAGAGVIGGCCGTTPEYIRLLHEMIQRKK